MPQEKDREEQQPACWETGRRMASFLPRYIGDIELPTYLALKIGHHY